MKKVWINLVAVLLLVLLVIPADAWQSKADIEDSGTSASVVFGPGHARTVVKNIYAVSDKADAVLALYQRDGDPVSVTAAATNAALVVSIDNADAEIEHPATVVIVHANGVVSAHETAAATATNVTLATGITQAADTSTRIYNVSQATAWPVGSSAPLWLAGEALWVTPGNSPLYAIVDSGTNSTLMVTIDN